jgi:probable rRNA maturation factor
VNRRVSIRQHLRPLPFRGDLLRSLVRKVLTRMDPPAADVRILVVGDEDMKRWNRAFLGKSGTTNVISFPEEENPAPSRGNLSGDVLVSAPTCLRQTRDWPGTPEERTLFFIIHGLLHLYGHDHERGPADARRMRREEMNIYGSVVGRSKR